MFKDPIQKLISKLKRDLKGFCPEETIQYYSSQYHHRIKGYRPEDDSDMILFQSGVYDWGNGINLEIDIVRQFIKNEDKIIQVHTKFIFPKPEDDPKKYFSTTWLSNPNDIEKWCSEIMDTPVIKEFGKKSDISPEIYLENAE